MTPSKESLDRAREWRLANTEIIERVNGSSYLKWNRPPEEFDSDLALEFDRVAIEAQLRIVNNLKGAERHEWWEMAEKLKAQLVAHNAGEGE